MNLERFTPSPAAGMAIELRPYQQEALTAVEAAALRGVRRQVVSLPTGAGKTVIFAHLIIERQTRTLILVHRDELIRQTLDKVALVGRYIWASLKITHLQAARADAVHTYPWQKDHSRADSLLLAHYGWQYQRTARPV